MLEAALATMSRFDISHLHSCRLMSLDPKTVRRKQVPDYPDILERLRSIAVERRLPVDRYSLMLEREGIIMNQRRRSRPSARPAGNPIAFLD